MRKMKFTLSPFHVTVCILSLAGALPFALNIMINQEIVPASYLSILFSNKNTLTYGAIILSFLSGIQWGLVISSQLTSYKSLLISSNIVTLAAWASTLLPNLSTSLILLIMGFIYQLIIDIHLGNKAFFPSWYTRLRKAVTLIVIMLLLIQIYIQYIL